jgi:hypothetical protein
MPEREAKARIKINKLLEEAGWCFEPSPDGPTNILLEPGIKHQNHLLPLEIQEQIVEHIESDITLYTQKISTTLTKLWEE